MSKQKKKRNKVYTGAGSNAVTPRAIRVEAVQRNKYQLWWHERKSIVKPILIGTLVITILAWLVYELLSLVFGGR